MKRCSNPWAAFAGLTLAAVGVAQPPAPRPEPTPPAAPPPRAAAPWPHVVAADGRVLTQEIPVSAYKFDLVPIPGDAGKGIKPFWMGRLEVAWEAMDVFVYRLDEGQTKDAPVPGGPAQTDPKSDPKPDAQSRPSKPYIPPDRGFGHEGFAAISVTHRTATEFARWLSTKSGRAYRLPSEAEWEHAARAGGVGERGLPDAAPLGDYAWFEANADDSPHPVGTKKPNAWGLRDIFGNVGEWADAPDGPVLKGGSYRDVPEKIAIGSRARQDSSWNSTDPQVPKSKWWLSDAPFAGLRVVCEMTDEEARRAFPPPAAPAPPSPPATQR